MTVRAALVSLLVSMLVLGGAVSYFGTVSDGIGLDSFQSRAAFHAYLEGLQADASAAGGFRWIPGGSFNDVTTAAEALDAGAFSGTNVQVAGVDEADILKTDGELIYLASGGEVVLIRAHPPASMGVVSRISDDALVGDREGEVQVLGLYLQEGILVVISSLYAAVDTHHIQPAVDVLMPMAEGRTLVSLFSTVDPAEPTLLHLFEFTGVYSASRLKGSVVYLVLQQAVSVQEEDASYPMVCMDRGCAPYDARRIYYDPEAPGAGSLTNVVAIDVETNAVGYLSLLTGYASTVYMSPGSLYVSFAKWGPLGEAFPRPDLIVRQTGFTSIYRIAVAGTDLFPTAGGNVEGWLLNQFSMDEHRGYLRVATTTGWGDPVNNVYILDPDLRVVGALEGLAPGESIYSARFLGDLGYLVTFQKVDPFFVLDLSDPLRPSMLGYLKIPGFSEYLHPIDKTHILGVGKDTLEDPSGTFAWFQGLKLSLFDVSNLTAPKEVAKYLAGDRGSSSPVLYDHKAFLYMEEDGLVVLPVHLVGRLDPGDDRPPWEPGTEPWQGALVLSVDPQRGFELRARISHLPADQEACWYGSGPYGVTRSLYIGAFLYTVSPTTLKAHSLGDFAEVASLLYAEPSGTSWC